jgi:hypothetical protein
MPVVATVAEKILREIVSRLELYDDAGIVFDVYREVTDPDRMTPTDYQVVVKMLSNTRTPELDRIGNPPVLAYTMTVGLFGQLAISESDLEAIEGHGFEIAGRMVKAVVTNASWYTMGSNAINSAIGDVVVNGSETYQSGQVSIVIVYRVRETDPFTASG